MIQFGNWRGARNPDMELEGGGGQVIQTRNWRGAGDAGNSLVQKIENL